MPDISHAWHHVSNGMCDTGDEDGSDISGSAEDTVPMPGVQSGGCSTIAADEPLDLTCRRTGGTAPPPTY